MKIAICDDDRQDLLHIVSLVEAYRDTRKAELTYVCFQNATTDNIKKSTEDSIKKTQSTADNIKKRRAPEIVLNDNNIHRTFTIGFSLIFGVLLSVCFAGVERTRKNRAAVGCVCLILLLAQTLCWWFWYRNNFEIILFDYPSSGISFPHHVFETPLVGFRRQHTYGYLCCQVPRWIGIVLGAVFDNRLVDHICYIAAIFVAYYLFRKYVADVLLQLMEKSARTCVLLGVVPLFYYLFDYITTIHTGLLQGVNGTDQFMPSALSIVYFLFIILYYIEIQKQTYAQRERNMLAAQLHGARSELVSLRQMQETAAAYRHDMRHHIAIMQNMASEGNLEKIKAYLNTAQSDIEAITPIRFCENETMNLILSTFLNKAKQAGVTMTVEAKLPESIPFSDTELCFLFSNGLENAITAAAVCTDPERRTVTVRAMIHKNYLLVSMENPYEGEIVMKDGLPQSSAEGHGYGTRSMAVIANAHDGQAIFSADNSLFSLKILLPI